MNEHMTKKEINGYIIKSYLKDRSAQALIYLFVVAIFFAVASLYAYEQVIRNMLYAVGITLFFGGVMAVIDFVKYREKSLTLFWTIQKEEKTGYLPYEKSLSGKLYQKILTDEEQEKRDLLTEYDEKVMNMADYYTMWAHQIKTSITAMRLLIQGSGADAGEKGRALIRQQLEELFKIEQYAQMALHFARLESISSDFLFKSCNICGIVKQAVKKYSILFLGSGLSFHMEEFDLWAVTDEKWLSLVVEQIFSNALKYTQAGGISIYGSDKEGKCKKGSVSYVTIEDTGIGIRQSDLPRIFERGFTGYNGRTETRSTGIGLYLCDQIVRKLSHTIRVKSVWGEGTKVILGFEQDTEVRKP